jgi:hypothetical protein
MEDSRILNWLFEWFNEYETLFWWLASGSVFVLIASMVAIPWLIIRLPADFFIRDERAIPYLTAGHPAFRVFLTVVKNVLGVTFILAGIAMLVLPGQGVLTIIVGLMLTNFPGKHKVVLWIVSKKSVIRGVNALRKRTGREPIMLPPHRMDSAPDGK